MEGGHRGHGVVRITMVKVLQDLQERLSSRCMYHGYKAGYCWACFGRGGMQHNIGCTPLQVYLEVNETGTQLGP